ncbi:MAG: sodium-dependent transporter [Sedimenticola sp.]|uniref:Transporter n=1 Tax=Sedimenticola thiotaurini TaxID=1543721 RepID=A0A558CX01_9GAMM|nr:sodium-dependent transporter [Sedimenticola sp.]TVT53265.1 MAG: sodium-dependent transporter [Sedimenticola thiotaurini]
MYQRISIHGQWSSRLMFILAATGSAVGLGNIWKFPYLTGEYGGGAFVLVYLICLALVGIPILIAEVMMGRRGRQSPVFSWQTLAADAGANGSWKLVGWAGMLAGLIILSYYSVIAGWTLAYLVRMASGSLIRVTEEGAGSIFTQLVMDPERMLAWHTIFMVMTIKVISRGVKKGLEQAVRILMPLLFALLLVLVIYAWRHGDFAQAYEFMFNSDFSKLTPAALLTALGHAFFTLSVGVGAMMVYGAYLPSRVSIAKTSILVALLDTIVALLAGLVIFSIVFAHDLAAGDGPGLIFQTLPIAFGQMPGGSFFGALFFLLLVFTAWTSSIALIEPMVSWLVEKRDVDRIRAAIWTGIVAWLLGIVTILSLNSWSFSFSFGGQLKHHGLFDVLDILTSSIILPLGGLCVALFVGWVMSRESVSEELGGGKSIGFKLWYFVVRFITPVAVLLVFLRAIGVV